MIFFLKVILISYSVSVFVFRLPHKKLKSYNKKKIDLSQIRQLKAQVLARP